MLRANCGDVMMSANDATDLWLCRPAEENRGSEWYELLFEEAPDRFAAIERKGVAFVRVISND